MDNLEGPEHQPSPLEDTREFTDAELIELRLFAEFFRKHPEFKWPRGNPYERTDERYRGQSEPGEAT